MSSKKIFSIEYSIRCSPAILFTFLSSGGGLQEWFADSVVQKNKHFDFIWGDTKESACLTEMEPDKLVRFKREGDAEGEYFEFRIEKTEIANETIFIITDYAEESELQLQEMWWANQVKVLFHRIGIH